MRISGTVFPTIILFRSKNRDHWTQYYFVTRDVDKLKIHFEFSTAYRDEVQFHSSRKKEILVKTAQGPSWEDISFVPDHAKEKLYRCIVKSMFLETNEMYLRYDE